MQLLGVDVVVEGKVTVLQEECNEMQSHTSGK
jgi:hypothetical protein